MAIRTVARMYDSHATAVAVVEELEAAGIPHHDISIVSNNRDDRYSSAVAGAPATGSRVGPSAIDSSIGDTGSVNVHEHDPERHSGIGAGTGATTGALLGGGAGLLAGLGMLAIPGIGPVVAAGWLAATLVGAGAGAAVGAAAGGLVGSLTGAGVPENEAHVYAEGVRRGGTVVTVRADELEVARVDTILNKHNPVDWETRDRDYRAAGWTGFDPNAPEYNDGRSGLSLADRARAGIV